MWDRHAPDHPTGVQVWNAETGEPRYLKPPVRELMRSARFSPDGRRFLSTVYRGGVFVWDAQTGERLLGLLKHEGSPVHAAEFSPDGSRIVTAGYDRTARVWDSSTGEALGRVMSHKGEVIHAVFSPDGRRILTVSWVDQAAFLWDAESGYSIGKPLRHADWVTYATFSPDGRWVITTSADKTARMWEAPGAASPTPEWLASLAEAIAGQRLDDSGSYQSVPLDRLVELRTQSAASGETGDDAIWAKWFFADRANRSPFAALMKANQRSGSLTRGAD
jgi:WD40 repeat protein